MPIHLTRLPLAATCTSAAKMGASNRGIWVLQTEEMFRDDDTARGDGPSSLLQGLVIERNLSGEHLTAAVSKGRTAVDDTDEAQLILNAPALLDRPVPARANPMARLHELGVTCSTSHRQQAISSGLSAWRAQICPPVLLSPLSYWRC